MRRAVLLVVVAFGLLAAPAPLRAQGVGPACVAIAPGAPAQVVLGTTVNVTGSCCPATVPALGDHPWLLAGILAVLLWRLGRSRIRRAGLLVFLAWCSFAAEDPPTARAAGTCALAWQAVSPFEIFTATGATFSFTPTIPASFQITLTAGSAVATQTLTVVPPTGDWLWQSTAPIPGAVDIQSIWATAPNDGWAVGNGGFAMHWDGTSWQPVASSTVNNLNGIWGSGATDVWAVAGGIGGAGAFNLIHWDGNAWSPVFADTSVNLAAVWGTGPNDVWAVGGSGVQGVITHFNGSAWHVSLTSNLTNLTSVWGSGPSDVWAVGSPYGPISNDESNSILHLLGGVWSPVADNAPNGQAKVLTSVWAASPGVAWATGFGAILSWNGTAWASSTAPSGYYQHVWGRTSNDVWAVGPGIFHFDGASWANQGINDVLLSAVGGSSTAAGGRAGVWAGGSQAIFALVPGSPLTCQAIGGTCGSSCMPGQGHVSDYPCDNGGTCCVSASACGGPSEPVCCSNSSSTPVPGLRPICRDGAYSCGPNATPRPGCSI
jgi:hypothetical protein